MKKRKDYFRLFMGLCKKHEVYFCVFSTGTLHEITLCNSGVTLDTYQDPYNNPLQLGSKAAYEWLKQCIAEVGE